MTLDEYNAFCGALPAASHGVQWGGAHVWKVGPWKGGKVFAIAGWGAEEQRPFITFKVSEIGFEVLKDQPGLRPAPYMASRGLSWIQNHGEPGLSDADLRHYLGESHRMAALGLTKKLRRELGLLA